MDDLIRRQAALKGFAEYSDGWCYINALPSVTLYGYSLKQLAFVATIMQKKGISPEEATRQFMDIGSMAEFIVDEINKDIERGINERFNQQASGD